MLAFKVNATLFRIVIHDSKIDFLIVNPTLR